MATPTPEIRERLMLTPMGRALLRLPTRGDRSQAELDRAPFMRHMTIPPDDAFRHRMSALPSPSKSPTAAIVQPAPTVPRKTLLTTTPPFMNHMAIPRSDG